jgi:hypothetical protein
MSAYYNHYKDTYPKTRQFSGINYKPQNQNTNYRINNNNNNNNNSNNDGWILITSDKRNNRKPFNSQESFEKNNNNPSNRYSSIDFIDDNISEYSRDIPNRNNYNNYNNKYKRTLWNGDIGGLSGREGPTRYKYDTSYKNGRNTNNLYHKYDYNSNSNSNSNINSNTEEIYDNDNTENYMDDADYFKNDELSDDESVSTKENNEASDVMISRKQNNYKKILCKNINRIGRCVYNNKCLYAHSLDEQNVEPIRVIVYDMIKKKSDLSHIDLSKRKQLYMHLQVVSKLCKYCEERTCTGGYNCKHGACDKIYVICQTDLNKGTCKGECGKIHLTEKGLIPYGISVSKSIKSKVTIPNATVINDDFFKKLTKNINSSNAEAEPETELELEIDIPIIKSDKLEIATSETSPFESKEIENKYTTMLKSDKNKTQFSDDDSIHSDDSTKNYTAPHKIEDFKNKKLSLSLEEFDIDSFDELLFDDISKREDKINKSIFKVDIMLI